MIVDLKYLRYFLTGAEERHITRAAEKLGMQRPPLNQRIKEIERRLEVQLFRRKARGIDLTDAGRVFLDKARTMLADYERALQSTRRAARGEQGELWIGIMRTAFFHPFVPSAIPDFRKDFPDVSVSLDECLRTEAFERGSRRFCRRPPTSMRPSPCSSCTLPTNRKPLRGSVLMRRCPSPLSPIALRTALRRVVSAASEMMRPSQIAVTRSSLLTTRSRLRIK